ALPRTWRLNAGGGAIAWAFTVDLGNATADPDNGMHSVALLGGMTPASGLYTVGSLTDTTINGSQDNLLLIKVNPANGDLIYVCFWFIPREDFSGNDNDVDRAGNQYAATAEGTAADRTAFLHKFAPDGGTIAASAALGGLGTQDRGNGVALVTRMPTDDVVMGRSTTTPSAAQAPPPVGCQTGYNGMVDGFVAKWSQPF